MTREEFIQELEESDYSYEIEGDKLVVTGGDKDGDLSLDSLQTLTPGVEFNNRGDVYLGSLKTIPLGVEFKNGGTVDLGSLIGDYFHEWNGSIKGISPNTLLNGMIKRGIFL